MRLVDADALDYKLHDLVDSCDSETCEALGVYKSMNVLLNTPTIEAIPLEWITSYWLNSTYIVDGMQIRRMVDVWRDEQRKKE